ncbi:NUDIX hydrolase [Aeromicrobium sp. UC242_57]|uniref:NUDIX hydrolase n=1 Tax=Aeromicrobium sp. UC242_57 TaxID=3374624 RepID=UPI0037B24C35
MIRIPLPARLRESAGNPPVTPVEPRQAATIVVVRDGAEGLEAYLMRRQASMAFAAGMYVFPGGGLMATDSTPGIPWFGPGPDEWAKRFGCDAELARGLVVAAVRETFEETGILLAGPDGDTVVSDTTGAEMEAARVALDAGEAGVRRLPGPAGARAAGRLAGRLGSLDHAGVRAAPLRHQVLRRSAASRPERRQPEP